MTEGASGADIKAICTEAGYIAIRAGRDYIIESDFIEAIKKILSKKVGRNMVEEASLEIPATPKSTALSQHI
jgi:ATP-dependent 26S proteasome regulatory subunit